jgi:hypothetical protein
MGSTLPLVETRLRMGPRSTLVTCTESGVRREKIGMRTAAAMTPAASQVLRLRRAGCPFELWLFDGKFFFVSSLLDTGRLGPPVFFQGGAGTTASSNLPPLLLGEETPIALAAVLH